MSQSARCLQSGAQCSTVSGISTHDKASSPGKSVTSFDNEKMAGLAGVGTQVGEERQWSYQIVFGESLKRQDKLLGPQVTFMEGTK